MKKIKLGDVCKIIKGEYITQKNSNPGKYPVVLGGTQPAYFIDKFNHVGEAIVISRSGASAGYVSFWNEPIFVTDGFLIETNDEVDYKFIYNFLKYRQKKITGSKKGTTIPHITPRTIFDIEIDLPPLEIQKKIGNFLYSLDEKISLNKKINATLKEMAKTIYLHKFFRKSANGKISDILKENPKSAISVGDAKNSSGDFPFFTSGENILRWNEKIVDGRNIFLNDGGNVGTKFYVGAAAYSTHTYCLTAKNNSADFLYLTLKIFELEIEKRFFTGTGLKNLRKDLLKDFAIYISTDEELKNFNSAVQPCFDMISKNFRENNLLEKLRDFLLPMLMNGQVGFKEK